MKIAFTAKGTGWDSAVDPRFGRTDYFVVYDEETGTLTSFDNQDVAQEAHGAGPRTAQRFSQLGAAVLITGNGPGGNAATVLDRMQVKLYTGAGQMTLKEAYEAWQAGTLPLFGASS